MEKAQLTEYGLALGDGKIVSLHGVYHLEWTANGGIVATRAGLYRVDRADAAAIEARLWPWEAQRDVAVEALSSAQRTEWLGGATLKVHAPRYEMVLLGFAALGSAWATLASWANVGLDGKWWVWACLFIAAVWAMYRESNQQFSVNGDRIRMGRARRPIKWSDLRSVQRCLNNGEAVEADAPEHRYLVETRGGRFAIRSALQTRHAEFAAAVLRAMAFRQEAAPAAKSDGRWIPSRKTPGEGLWVEGGRALRVEEDDTSYVTWTDIHPEADHTHYKNGDLTPLRAAYALDGELVIELPQLLLADARYPLRPGEVATTAELEKLMGVKPGESLPFYEGQLEAGGLVVRAGRHDKSYRWDQIELLEWRTTHLDEDDPGEPEDYCRVKTDGGYVDLPTMDRRVERVVGAIERVLLACEAGMRLPNARPVPEGALSPASANDALVSERAISRSGRKRS